MRTLKITLGDDNNSNYKRDVEIEVSGTMYLILQDKMSVCSWEEYNEAWDDMCDMIDRKYRDLPREWFIDKIEF